MACSRFGDGMKEVSESGEDKPETIVEKSVVEKPERKKKRKRIIKLCDTERGIADCGFGDGIRVLEPLKEESADEKPETIEKSGLEKPESKKNRKLFPNCSRNRQRLRNQLWRGETGKLAEEKPEIRTGETIKDKLFFSGARVDEKTETIEEEPVRKRGRLMKYGVLVTELRKREKEEKEEACCGLLKPQRKKKRNRITKLRDTERGIPYCGFGHGITVSEPRRKRGRLMKNGVLVTELRERERDEKEACCGFVKPDVLDFLITEKFKQELKARLKALPTGTGPFIKKSFDKSSAPIIQPTVLLNYDRDYYPPELGERFKRFATLAIDVYNYQEDTDYFVVDMVRVSSSPCEGTMWYVMFTAKSTEQDDAAAVTFKATVYDGIEETEVDYVYMIDAPAHTPLTSP